MRFTKLRPVVSMSRTVSSAVLSAALLSACGALPEIRYVAKSTIQKQDQQQEQQQEKQQKQQKQQEQEKTASTEEVNSVDNIPSEQTQRKAVDTVAVSSNPYLTSRRWVSSHSEQDFKRAVTALQQQDWARAEALLKRLIEASPRLSGPYVNLSIVYRKTGREEEAQKVLQQAIQANGKNLTAYNELAILQRQLGLFEAAEKTYKQALDVWPDDAESHRNLGILYELYMGKFERALYHYEKSQSLTVADDKQLAGWIFDLKRRLKEVADRG
jgi:tetratricopeptide (TPR) repeat protein